MFCHDTLSELLYLETTSTFDKDGFGGQSKNLREIRGDVGTTAR